MATTYLPKYWNGIAKNQDRFQELFSELVPLSGKAETVEGEILRIVARYHSDIYNNSGCNMSSFRKERSWMLSHIPDYAKNNWIEFTKSFKYGKSKTAKEMKMIDNFIDWVVVYVEALILVKKSQEALEMISNEEMSD